MFGAAGEGRDGGRGGAEIGGESLEEGLDLLSS